MLILRKNKNLLIAIFCIFLLFQILSFSVSYIGSTPKYYNDCSTTFHEELTNYAKNSSPNDLIVKFDIFPIYPEVENIKCLNKIIGKSYDNEAAKTIYQVGYSNIIYYLQFLAFLSFIILNFKFFKFKYLEVMVLLNLFLYFQFKGLPAYILFTQILKLNIFLFTFGIFIFNLKNIYYKNDYDSYVKKINEKYISLFLLNICLFIFFEHMKNFFYKAYYLHLSEWTVNYTGGLNRRGLIGEIVTSLYSGSSLKLLIAVLITSIYFWLIFNIFKIFKAVKQNYLSVFIFLSPFYVLFVINDFRGGNSKEIMGFLALTLLILYDLKKNISYLFTSLIIFFIAVYSHNLNIFIFPVIIFYIFNFSRFDKKQSIAGSYFLIVLSNIIAYFSPLMQNSFFDKIVWCNEIISKYNLYETCFELYTGNLLNLKVNDGVFENIAYTISNANLITFVNYFIIFVFINLYIFNMNYFKKYLKTVLVLYASFLPLFVLALDWGRWMHILFFSLFSIYLADKDKIINTKYLFVSSFIFLIPTFVFYNPHCCAAFSIRNIISYDLDTFHLFDFFLKLYNF